MIHTRLQFFSAWNRHIAREVSGQAEDIYVVRNYSGFEMKLSRCTSGGIGHFYSFIFIHVKYLLLLYLLPSFLFSEMSLTNHNNAFFSQHSLFNGADEVSSLRAVHYLPLCVIWIYSSAVLVLGRTLRKMDTVHLLSTHPHPLISKETQSDPHLQEWLV